MPDQSGFETQSVTDIVALSPLATIDHKNRVKSMFYVVFVETSDQLNA